MTAIIGLTLLALIVGWAMRNGFAKADAMQRGLIRDVLICHEADRAERDLRMEYRI